MNSFVTELHNFLDVKFFQQIADDIISDDWLTLPDPDALGKYTDRTPISVYDYNYLELLQERYPGLANQVKFMKSSYGTWPTHFDSHRKCAINIPLFNTNDTITRFYVNGTNVDSVEEDFGGKKGKWYSNEYLTYVIDAEPAFDHVLTVPSIINTSKPHGIFNNGNRPRIICSWAYNGTYEEAVKELNDGC